jgi:hypothetical protein
VPVPPAGVVAVDGAGVVPVLAGGVVPVPALVELLLELDVELLLERLVVAEEAGPEPLAAGTVNAGAPEVSFVLEPPPPQALRPTVITIETAIAR